MSLDKDGIDRSVGKELIAVSVGVEAGIKPQSLIQKFM